MTHTAQHEAGNLSVSSNPLPATENNPLGENNGLTSECSFVVAEYQETIAFQGVRGPQWAGVVNATISTRWTITVLAHASVYVVGLLSSHIRNGLASLFETVSLIIRSSNDVTDRQPFASVQTNIATASGVPSQIQPSLRRSRFAGG